MSDPVIATIATRERCAVCNRISAVGFWVPDEIWEAVVHHSRLHDIHCLACFADFADAKMVQWDRNIKFYPVSLVAHLRSDDPIERGMLNPSPPDVDPEGVTGETDA